MKKTLFAIKLESKTVRSFWHLLAMLLGFLALLALVASAQVYFCRKSHPTEGVVECLRGLK